MGLRGRAVGAMGRWLVPADTFRDVHVGCVGAILLTLFTVASVLGLLAMAWWMARDLL